MSTIQETEQEKRQLTFEEICPLWAEKTREGNLHKENGLNLSEGIYCVVGEAWKFKSRGEGRPNCQECIDHGFKIWGGALRGNVGDIYYVVCPEYHKAVEDFVEHWNEAHV